MNRCLPLGLVTKKIPRLILARVDRFPVMPRAVNSLTRFWQVRRWPGLSHFMFGLLIPFFGNTDSMSSIRPMSTPSSSAVRICAGAWIVFQNLICRECCQVVDRIRGFEVAPLDQSGWRWEAVPLLMLLERSRVSEEVVFSIDKRRRGFHTVRRLHRIIPCGPVNPMPVPFPG